MEYNKARAERIMVNQVMDFVWKCTNTAINYGVQCKEYRARYRSFTDALCVLHVLNPEKAQEMQERFDRRIANAIK